MNDTITEQDLREWYRRHGKPGLARMLAAFGLDVVYHRASGDRLWYRDDAGVEHEVLDLVGSFGATLFGHNPPELVDELVRLARSEPPNLVQASIRGGAALLAQRLAEAGRARLGADYVCSFLSTGAEAVEAAIKHLILIKRGRLADRAEALQVHAAALLREHQRTCGDGSPRPLRARVRAPGFPTGPWSTPAALLADLAEYNRGAGAGPFGLVAFEQGYHGKTLGALGMTHNPRYRDPFATHLLPVRFVRPEAQAVTVAVDHAPITLARLVVGTPAHRGTGGPRPGQEGVVAGDAHKPDMAPPAGGPVAVAHSGWVLLGGQPAADPDDVPWIVEVETVPSCMGVVIEPVRGEGGVLPLPGELLREIAMLARARGVPVVADEIQSGMGRTGSFFAWERAEAPAPDIVLLSKILGGGLAKVAAVMSRADVADDEFGITHTSTFAEDDLGCRLAARVVGMVLADDGRVLDQVRRRGDEWHDRLTKLACEFPQVVREVRGCGLLWGLEFCDLRDFGSNLLRFVCTQGDLGYVLAGYLLHEHGIRVAPTLNARRTVRIEPSVLLGPDDMDRVVSALRALCVVLTRADTAALTRFVLTDCQHRRGPVTAPATGRRDPGLLMQPGPHEEARVAFLGHFIDPTFLARHEPVLAGWTPVQLDQFVRKTYEYIDPCVFACRDLTSATGARVNFNFVGLSVTSEILVDHLKRRDLAVPRAQIRQALAAARDRGCRLVGFGQFTSIVTRNCEAVTFPGLGFTSGNALTTGMTLSAAEQAVAERGWHWENLTVAVFGGGGNIGSIFARLVADRAARVVLVGGSGQDSRRRLEATAAAIVADQLRRQVRGEPLGPLGQRVVAAAAGGRAVEQVVATLLSLPANEAPLCLGTIDDARTAAVVITAANAPHPFIEPHHLADDVVLCDVSIPSAATAATRRRAGVTAFKGGVVALPNREVLEIAALPLEPGHVYACMAETILLGLERRFDDFSVGAITREQVETMLAIAGKHGFKLARPKLEDSL